MALMPGSTPRWHNFVRARHGHSPRRLAEKIRSERQIRELGDTQVDGKT
jgi:hypothetical protein